MSVIVFDDTSCLFPNCLDKNIKSHAISESISLRKISENNHVYHFLPKRISRTDKGPDFKLIGVSDATAHGGFCPTHDNFFQSLDKVEISTSKDILLQAFRSLCILNNEEKTAAISLYKLVSWRTFKNSDAYKNIPIDLVEAYLRSNGGENLIPSLDKPSVLEPLQRKVHFLIADSVDDELRKIERLSDYIMLILKNNESLEMPVGELFTITTENMDYVVLSYKTDFQIPVCINAVHHCNLRGESLKIFSIVVPYESSSVVISIVPKSLCAYEDVQDRLDGFFSNEIKVIEFVESIISTCDGWYMRPSIINAMSSENKQMLLEDCMFYDERSIFEQYDISIFEDLKKEISLRKKISYSSERIEAIADRDPYSLRYKKMMDKLVGNKQ